MELTFRTPVDPADLTRVPGVQVTSSRGQRINCRMSGQIAPLLQAALPLGLVDVTAQAANLDELFLDYYATPDRQGVTDGDAERVVTRVG